MTTNARNEIDCAAQTRIPRHRTPRKIPCYHLTVYAITRRSFPRYVTFDIVRRRESDSLHAPLQPLIAARGRALVSALEPLF